MEACNHSTFSRAILKAAAEVELPYERIWGVVSDSAALAHIVNLAADVFQKIAEFAP